VIAGSAADQKRDATMIKVADVNQELGRSREISHEPVWQALRVDICFACLPRRREGLGLPVGQPEAQVVAVARGHASQLLQAFALLLAAKYVGC